MNKSKKDALEKPKKHRKHDSLVENLSNNHEFIENLAQLYDRRVNSTRNLIEQMRSHMRKGEEQRAMLDTAKLQIEKNKKSALQCLRQRHHELLL